MPDPRILRERLIQLTRDLVLIESTDDRPGERARCFQLIRNHLDEVPGIRLRMLKKNGYESLLALPKGVDKPRVLLCGHLDVVHHPEPDCYQSEVRDGKIFGPGAGDMKGQLAIMIELLRHLGRERSGISLGIAVTSDEEQGGENGVKFLVEEAGVDCDFAVIPDGGSLTDVTVEEKGILHLELSVEGASAHAARPWLGRNALEKLTAELADIRAHFDAKTPLNVDPDDTTTHWFSTCSLTLLETPNDSINRIPEKATAALDIRFVPPHSTETLFAEIRKLVDEKITLRALVSAEPTHLAPDETFLRMTEEVTGVKPRLVHASAGSDARFFAARGIPVLLSRPKVENLHGRDESIEIESMLSYFEICRRYVLEKSENRFHSIDRESLQP